MRRIIPYSHIFGLLLSVVLFQPQSLADTLKVGLGELDYPPFYYQSDGQLMGVATEMAETLAQQTGHTLQYIRVPWSRLQKMLELGSLDMVILYFKTPERTKHVIYTDSPHVYENSNLVVPARAELQYDGGLSSLSKYDFVNVRGYSHGQDYDSANFLVKHAVNDELELLKRLVSGRMFIGVGNKPALLYYAKKLGMQQKIRFIEPPIDRGANYIAFSKKHPSAKQLAEQFSTAFSVYSATPAYRITLEKYGFDASFLPSSKNLQHRIRSRFADFDAALCPSAVNSARPSQIKLKLMSCPS